MPPPPLPEYKHFCRVCNKGFTCGSALGGHMRAHGASDVLAVDDDDDSSLADELPGSPDDRRWDDAAAGTSSSPAAATHAYALRANPNRLVRSCQVCKNCSKEFTSWELFLEHGRCSSDDDEEGGREGDGGSPRRSASPPSDANDGEEDPAVAAAAWSKGKRSRRVKLMTTAADDVPSRRCASGEEEDLANCLVMLSSSSNADHAAAAVAAGTGTSHQEPCAPVSKERDRVGPQLLQPISFLAPAPEPVMAQPSVAAATIQYAPPAPRGLFECKACKKVFTSHQALGGHRASHKKVKGCFAARFDSDNAVSETPIRHAATTDLNYDNGKAVAAVEAGTTHRAIADANKPSIYASADGGDANVGTSEAAAATLSMALVAPVIHELPPVAAAFNVAAAAPSKKNAKMHECSVCHRLFTSGQALGGHKRCHWLTTSSAVDPTNLTVPPLTEDLVGAVRHQLMLRPMADPPEPALDLTIAAKPSPLRAEPGSSSFHLDASAAALHLQSPAVPGSASHRNRTSTTSGHDGNNDAAATASTAAEDEAESTATKRARLTDLKDVVRMDGEATEPWLQVGIGSSSPAAGGDDKTTRE